MRGPYFLSVALPFHSVSRLRQAPCFELGLFFLCRSYSALETLNLLYFRCVSMEMGKVPRVKIKLLDSKKLLVING
jgi:hypothetical protein